MTEVAENYAQALYGLAKDEGVDTAVLQQLETLGKAISQEPAFLRLLASQNLSKEQRCSIIEESFRGKVHDYVLNFLKLLTEKQRIRCFQDCCKAYRAQYNEDRGIVCVKAVTAVEMTPAQTDKLQKKLEQITGKQVELKNKVDPACVGGVRLDYEGKCIDGTLQNRLTDLGNLLKNTVL